MEHKAGFVNIIGKPNVGKSTLMNELVGERLSIITSKAQTTRHRIMGIVNGDDFQIVYSDTPGYMKPHYKLQETMMDFVEIALTDADILLYLIDISDKEPEDETLVKKVQNAQCPVIIVINKLDLRTQDEITAFGKDLREKYPKAEIIAVSALMRFNLNVIFDLIIEKLPENPPYYDKSELTDKPERFFASEIIREKLFLNYKQEIPYSCEVVVNTFKEKKDKLKNDITHIQADIFVERESQKGIVIGSKGEDLKWVGTKAREDMERFFLKKVYLELIVKVKENWRDNAQQLKQFGYKQN